MIQHRHPGWSTYWGTSAQPARYLCIHSVEFLDRTRSHSFYAHRPRPHFNRCDTVESSTRLPRTHTSDRRFHSPLCEISLMRSIPLPHYPSYYNTGFIHTQISFLIHMLSLWKTDYPHHFCNNSSGFEDRSASLLSFTASTTPYLNTSS